MSTYYVCTSQGFVCPLYKDTQNSRFVIEPEFCSDDGLALMPDARLATVFTDWHEADAAGKYAVKILRDKWFVIFAA
jgi:hypothetical protein